MEYGSTRSFASRNGENRTRTRIMIGLCVASMLLAIAALSTNEQGSRAMTLEEKMQALKSGAQGAAETMTSGSDVDAPHPLAQISSAGALAATHDVTAPAAAKPSPNPQKPNPKPRAEGTHEATSSAPAQAQTQVSSVGALAATHEATAAKDAADPASKPENPKPKGEEPEKPKPKGDDEATASVVKPESAAKTASTQSEQTVKSAHAASSVDAVHAAAATSVGTSTVSKAAAGHAIAEQAEAAKNRQLALAHLARVSKHAAVHGHMLASNSTADGAAGDASASDSAPAAAAGGDDLNSPLGNMEPTGIMSVFFNEKVRCQWDISVHFMHL